MQQEYLKTLIKSAFDHHQAGDLVTAQKEYEEVLKEMPENPTILYNLSLVFIALENTQKARETLEKLLDIHPGHVDALNNLGAILIKENQPEEAMQCFAAILATQPEHQEARNNMAAVLLTLGRYHHAAEHYRFLLEKNPDDLDVLYSYGITCLEKGDYDNAIISFQKVLSQEPEHINAISNTGIAYLKSGNLEKAREYFEKIIHRQDVSPEVHFLYSAITHKNIPEKPPEIYIENLFNHYAKFYEQHMEDVLKYKAPELLKAFFITAQKENINKQYTENQREYDILDLGCGTGLSGIPFKPYANKLIGVDLSQKMLDLAQHKNIYTQLICEDIFKYLNKTEAHFDLILSCDTFNYFGDLEKLFLAAHQKLKKQGYILFTLEKLLDDNHAEKWQLMPQGRYQHSEAYLGLFAKKTNFEIIKLENTVLRYQNDKPVNGWLILFQRKEL